MAAFIKNRQQATAWQAEKEEYAPKPGDPAPDFDLSDWYGVTRVRLSEIWPRKPVVLIFGSYT